MLKQVALALGTLVVAVAATGCGGSGDSSPVPTTDDTNEVNARALSVFDCKTLAKVDGKDHRIQFSVRNIADRRRISVLTPEGREDEDYTPIKTTPAEGRVAALNENLGAATGSRMLRISGDSDGFYLIELVLYKDSAYKNGYLRIYGSEDDGPHQYAKVSCTVTSR